jgi:hypothetical protein
MEITCPLRFMIPTKCGGDFGIGEVSGTGITSLTLRSSMAYFSEPS